MSTEAVATVVSRDKAALPAAGPLGLIRRYPIAALVILTLILTWLFEIPRVLDARGELSFPWPLPLVLLGGWMPGCAAIIVAGATGGRAAVRTLFRRILLWRVGWPWYVLAIGGSAAIWLSAVALNPLFGGSGLQIPELSTDLLIGPVINFVLLFLINSEELVWRGSMLPRLQAYWSSLVACLVIGVFEALFHLPSFFSPGSDQAATGLPVFVVGSVAGAIIFSWIFNNTMGSLLLVQLFHIFVNTWITLFPATPADNVVTQWLFNSLIVLLAAIVVVVFGARRLSRKPAAVLPALGYLGVPTIHQDDPHRALPG